MTAAPLGGGTVEGTVLGVDGSALPGAGVTLTDAGGHQLSRTSSDGDGHFQLFAHVPGTHLLICNAAGFAPSVARIEMSGTTVRRDIVISGGCSLTGRIRDGTVPVAATVTLIDDTGATVTTTTTGRRGNYTFEGLRAAHYVLAAAADGTEPTVRTVDVTGDDVLDVELVRHQELGGTVRDETGGPVGGATVVLSAADGRELARTVTGPDGRFHLDNPPDGTHTLTASARTEVRREITIPIPTELDVAVPIPPRDAAAGYEPAERTPPGEWHLYQKPEAGRRRARRGRAPFRKS